MRIEVLLVDQINDKINNYDENLNLFEANKFEAKQNEMFFMSNHNSSEETTTLIVGTNGCETEYDFVKLGSLIGQKLNKDCEVQLTAIPDNLNMFMIEFGIILSTYNFPKL